LRAASQAMSGMPRGYFAAAPRSDPSLLLAVASFAHESAAFGVRITFRQVYLLTD